MQQRHRRSRQQWKQILIRQQKSELGVAQFCRQESLSVSNFYNWRSRLDLGVSSKPAALEASSFIDLGRLDGAAQTVSHAAAERWELELNLGNGMTLKFRQL